MTQPNDILAIAAADHGAYGCPYCGFRSGSFTMTVGCAAASRCGECGRQCIVLGDGLTISPIGVGRGDAPAIHPTLGPHPRAGIPAHGRPDDRPPEGGEYFAPRGIGVDRTPGCFVCGGADDDLRDNIAAFVQCRAAGERIVAMFKRGARLDYRDYEPDRVQVKIGACAEHVPQLRRLYDETLRGVITQDIADSAGGG